MTKFFKDVTWICVFGLVLLTTGCSSVFTPATTGQATGRAIYIGYTRISETKSTEFKTRVAELWSTINAIETKEQLVGSMNILDVKFKELMSSKELSESDILIIQTLYATIADKVKLIMADSLTSNDQALEFLVGVRSGINEMIKLYSATSKK